MKKWLLSLNLFQRLLLYFLIIMIVPLILVSSIIYIQSSKLLEEQTEEYLEQVITNLSYQSDRYIRNYELATLPLVSNPNVKYFLDLNDDNTKEHIRYQYYESIWSMMDQIAIQHPAINRMYIIGDNGRHIASQDNSTFPREEKYKNLHPITPENGKIIIQPSDKHDDISITIARKIRGMESFSPNGILAIEVSIEQLGELWRKTRLGDNGFFMITDTNGKVIYHPDFKFIGETLNEVGRMQVSEFNQGTFFEEWDGKDTFFRFLTSDYTGWKLIAGVPESQLLAPIAGVRQTALISAGIVVLIACLLAISFIKHIVHPIRLIERTMKSVEQGKWEKVPNFSRNDEIKSLVNSYNTMVDKLSTLVEQVYKAELKNKQVKIELQERELEKQKIEIQALQSQINPHFLYNTLETMGGYGLINGIEEISDMAESLAHMFRYSIRNLEIVELSDEIEHIRNYLTIHECRMKKPISLNLEIEEEVYHAQMVKLSLQPLIENAIEHGLKKTMKELEITIRTFIQGTDLHVCVIDNGKGISAEKLEEIKWTLKKDNRNNHKFSGDLGIGVTNVNRRIELLFGEKYGLDFESKENEGTTVSVIIPYRKNEKCKPA